MTSLLRNSTFAVIAATALASAFPTGAARASDHDLNGGSRASVLISGYSAVMVVSGPLFLSAAGARGAADLSSDSRERRDERARRIGAGPLPDMRVNSVATADDGGRRVTLEDPQNAENTATLQWPKREDDPAAGFSEGAMVAFQPSPQGSGWMVRDDTGTALAFVPTIQTADESRTRVL
ncbi:hypothetical protein [Stenotrophomonas mori]|uniref:Transmembrane protein n=1 Tax=Stenotrophomonas mori TaxID=2871096 RepID=A0ABT0SHW7_9GAMM|nr:hypothetical protein [Stenotrophomonas mori]MCL7714917.1 hypothetical protein [Stenotrophomonas mori]